MSLLTVMCARNLSTWRIQQSLLLAIIPVEWPTLAHTLLVLVFILNVKRTENLSELATDALSTVTNKAKLSNFVTEIYFLSYNMFLFIKPLKEDNV